MTNRVLVWFSCGAASAVAAKLAVEKYGDRCEVLYCDTLAYEHPDNMRFLKDVERWIGKPIGLLKSDKYSDIYDVFDKTGWLIGVGGARCTTELKKNVRKAYQKEGDTHVFGLTSDETKRIERFEDQNPDTDVEWVLLDNNINKKECYRRLVEAGIELPTMYKLGYNNNNCIGCVKGQAGYWNKIRVDFPDAFDRMAKQERKMGVAINKTYAGDGKRKRVFLDELDPSAGRGLPLPDIECGALCITPEKPPELLSIYDEIISNEEKENKMPIKHAKLSASGSAKWMACPGSVAAEEGLPDGSSEHSREGSAAHHVAEQVLVNGGYASDWIGKKIEDYDIEVSHAMADYVQQYVDYVKSLGGTQLYEQRVDFSHVVPDGFGTSDAIVMEGRTLHIVDLKYGKGVKVYAQDNSQALLYAVGVVNDFSYLFEFDKVQVTIVQPRLDHIDEWEVDVPTLEKFAAYAKIKAEEALMPNAPRNPGEKQCQWCKAKFQCPELKRKTESVLMADFDNMEEAPTIDKLTHEQMAEILKHKKLITSFLEAIEKYVFAKLEDGQPFPGYKLVEGRSNRKISDEEFAIRMLHQNGYKDEQIMKPAVLKTITELEKLLGKKEFALTLGDVIVKPEGAPTLATEDDPRKPIAIGVSADDFS